MRAHLGLFAIALTLACLAGGRDAADRWINTTALPPLLTVTGAEVLDRNRRTLRVYTVGDGRWRLEPGPVDAGFTDMLIAYEDRRFRTHFGVNLRAMLRATMQAVWNGGIVSGGSTLTMQVARLMEDGSTGQWAGKLRQVRLALALERRLTKDQILQIYLTRAPYGGNIEGIRAAALAWFGKEPARLTPAEAALLVALPQSPEARRPDRHRKTAQEARGRVLDRMARQGILSNEAASAATLDPVPVARRPFPALAPHLADRAIADAPGALRHDLTIDAALQAQL